MTLKERVFQIIEPAADSNSVASRIYDLFMSVCILVSITPLLFKNDHPCFFYMDVIPCSFFIIDYLLRWWTADLKYPKQNRWLAHLSYPCRVWAIIDMLSILPTLLAIIPNAFRALRLLRLLRIFRIFKLGRYFESVNIIINVIRRESVILTGVLAFALFYIFLTALIMFNFEPSTFNNFYDAIYWATCTLTTVGYGDMCPHTDVGRFISMFSALVGVAIIALPSGVITAAYLDELKERKHKNE